jgi:putative ABC transport system substrate-binding protein
MRRREFIAGLGAAAAWPLAARAQQSALPVIGFLSGLTESAANNYASAFRQGLAEEGYGEGRNVDILYRWAETQFDRLPTLVADLVRRRVAVIVATGGASATLAATSATTMIPIVSTFGTDPVEVGLVARINRPGGNVTGASFLTTALTAKRLELLHEVVPAATSIGFLVNPTSALVEAELKEAETAARIIAVRLVILRASTPSEIDNAFVTVVAQRIGALLASADPLVFEQRAQLAALAAHHAVPAIYHAREIVDAGGLMSYGASISDAYRLARTYSGRILKGEKPADLPVQQSTKVELVINPKTAKALGLTFPITLLGRADEVIE